MKLRQLSLLISFLAIIFTENANSSAIDMAEGDIILLKNIAARSYSDSIYDRDVGVNVQNVTETINGIPWTKLPFRTVSQSPASIGTVYYSNNPSALVVAFHGSWWLKDWFDDAKFLFRPASDLHPHLRGNIHTGFSTLVIDAYQDMINKMQQILGRNLRPDDNIFLTGHSLGGALAMLAGVMTTFHVNSEANRIKIITFSTPRGVIGDPEFVKQASKRLATENIISFGTKGDSIPYLPQKIVSFLCRYEPLGTHIEILPTEKVISHYKSLPQNLTLDDLWDHPTRPIAWVSITCYLGLNVAGPGFIAAEYFKVFHAIPTDQVLKDAFRFTQLKYKNTSSHTENMGEVTLNSVQRNSFIKFLYGLII